MAGPAAIFRMLSITPSLLVLLLRDGRARARASRLYAQPSHLCASSASLQLQRQVGIGSFKTYYGCFRPAIII